MDKEFVIVHNIASPYRVHLFSEMNRQLKDCGIGFHVHFMSDMARGYENRPVSWRNPKMDFSYTYWRDYGYSHYDFNPGLVAYLLRNPPDWLYICSCFDTITGILLSLFGRAKVAKFTGVEGNTKTPGELRGWKGFIKRVVLAQHKFAAVPGRDAIQYLALLQKNTKRKMPEGVLLPNLINEERFCPRERWDANEIDAIRKSMGVGVGERLAIIPARLEPEKGLLECFSLLTPDILEGWRIVVLGQGSLHGALMSLVKDRAIDSRILIKDFVPYSEMPKYYAAADLFVLPSIKDPNPLSVIEALHSGLPVALSAMAGNIEEAVSEGRNGWILPVKDPAACQKILRKVFLTSAERLREMGRYSKIENSQFWNTQGAVGNFLRGIGVK